MIKIENNKYGTFIKKTEIDDETKQKISELISKLETSIPDTKNNKLVISIIKIFTSILTAKPELLLRLKCLFLSELTNVIPESIEKRKFDSTLIPVKNVEENLSIHYKEMEEGLQIINNEEVRNLFPKIMMDFLVSSLKPVHHKFLINETGDSGLINMLLNFKLFFILNYFEFIISLNRKKLLMKKSSVNKVTKELIRRWELELIPSNKFTFKLFESTYTPTHKFHLSEKDKMLFAEKIIEVFKSKLPVKEESRNTKYLQNELIDSQSPSERESPPNSNLRLPIENDENEKVVREGLMVNPEYLVKVEEVLIRVLGDNLHNVDQEKLRCFIKGEKLNDKIDYQGKKSDIPLSVRLLNELPVKQRVIELSIDELVELLLETFTVKGRALNKETMKQNMALNPNHTDHTPLFNKIKEIW